MIVRSNLLITGYAGTPHVTAAQQGACNAAMYGTGKYVLGVGSQFAYEIVSNNLIKIQDGYAINQGRLMGIDNTLYEEMIIDNGLQGVKRVDLICMKYTQNVDTGVETVEMVVVKGTSGDTYADPSTVSGDILAGAVEDDFPLYRVKIDGINIVAVEALFNVMVSAQELVDKIGTTNISSIGDGTATGAISAINNNLSNIIQIKQGYFGINGTSTSWTQHTSYPQTYQYPYKFPDVDGYKFVIGFALLGCTNGNAYNNYILRTTATTAQEGKTELYSGVGTPDTVIYYIGLYIKSV